MVAWHEMPGKAASRNPSRLVLHSQDGDGGRARCDRVAPRYVHHSRLNDALADQSYRSLWDGSFLAIAQAFHAWLPSCSPYGTLLMLAPKSSLDTCRCAIDGSNHDLCHHSRGA